MAIGTHSAWISGMSGNANSDNGNGSIASAKETKHVTRRMMLKGSASAMPAIMTLKSGAAHARSSNLIGASPYPERDRQGRLLCLNIDSVSSVGGSEQSFDIGEYGKAEIVAITERDYRAYPRMNAPRVSEERACLEGRTVYYIERRDSWTGNFESEQDSGTNFTFRRDFKSARVPRGVFVSATALSSFVGNYVVREI